jgi:periplasmic divalent cation tolerance protein
MQAIMVYVTASDPGEARKIGRALVEQRLVACVNIFDHIRSVFWWEGDAQSEEETAFTAKTTMDKLDAVVETVKSMHSYEVPCVVALPIVGGNPDFLQWIGEETGGQAPAGS